MSRASFFGDQEDKAETRQGGIFTKVDDTTIPNLAVAASIVDEHVPDDETSLNFAKESPGDHYYDYKNNVLSTDQTTGKPIDNTMTAYMVNGVLLNRNEAGNLLWGAAKVGLPLNYTRMLAHTFTALTERKYDEMSEQQAITIGYNAFKDFRPEKVIKRK